MERGGDPEIHTLFIDDLEGIAADETTRIGLDGAGYDINLNGGHAQALRRAELLRRSRQQAAARQPVLLTSRPPI